MKPVTFKPDAEAKKARQEKLKSNKPEAKPKDYSLSPLNSLLSDYRKSLGAGVKPCRGIATGIKEIDNLSHGLTGLVLLSGLSAVGKTSLAVQLATSTIAHNQGNVAVLFYSLEMPRDNLLTSFIEVSAHLSGHADILTRDDIELHGNDPELPVNKRKALDSALDYFQNHIAEHLFILDSSRGTPTVLPTTKPNGIVSILSDINEIKSVYKANQVLVVIDSIQDMVDTNNANQVQSEVALCNNLSTLISKTNCAVLAIGQKNKSSIKSSDHYGDTMGSVAYIHKSDIVWLLNTTHEVAMKKGLLPSKARQVDSAMRHASSTGKTPLELYQLKGRYGGTGSVHLTFHNKYSWFEPGIDKSYSDIFG